MSGYELADIAKRDLDEIYDYTAASFGAQQAVAYLNALEEKFGLLAIQPELGRKRPEIRKGLRSFACEAHVIFYRPAPFGLYVLRVMHGNRDLPKWF